jgi:hypothetical protein
LRACTCVCMFCDVEWPWNGRSPTLRQSWCCSFSSCSGSCSGS